MYIIAIDQGDYLQERGGYDWGRSSAARATRYDSHEEAMYAACQLRLHCRWAVEECW